MESEEAAPVTTQHPVPVEAGEGTHDGGQTAAQQPGSIEVEHPLSPQQSEPLDAEGVQPSAPAEAQQPETVAVTGDRPASDPSREATGSAWAVSVVTRSMSVPSTLETLPVPQLPLSQAATQGSSTGSSSDWISNATEINYFSSSSDHSNHARHNCQLNTNGTGRENEADRSDLQSGVPSQDAGGPVEAGPSVSAGGASVQPDQPHGTGSSGSGPGSRKDSSVASTSSMSFSVPSSGSDPTKPNILDSVRRNSLDTDDEDMEIMACLTPLNNLVEAYSEYFEEVEQQQTEEYIMEVIKSYVEMTIASTADMHIIAKGVFGSPDHAKSTGRESPHMTEEEAKGTEQCESLERRLQAVRDYVRVTSEDTSEASVEEMILEEYELEMKMAETGVSPMFDPIDSLASKTAGYKMEVQGGGELPGGKTEGDVAAGGVKKEPTKMSAEEAKCAIEATCASLKRARESLSDGKESLSRTSSGSNSDRERVEHALSSYFEQMYPESRRQRKIRKTQQKAAVLKIFSLAQARVCAIRAMNWVMLRCLKIVTTVVNHALEANRVAHRTIWETAALRSEGNKGDHAAAMAEAATAATHCAETAVREIEEAVQLHKQVVDGLLLSERTLFNIKTESCEGGDLVRHLFLGVELIEIQMKQACRTYLDKSRGRESLNSSRSTQSSRSTSPVAFSTCDGIHGPVVRRAFDSIEDGPSDVFQALIWACQSSMNAMEMVVKGLQEFSIAKLRKPRSSAKK